MALLLKCYLLTLFLVVVSADEVFTADQIEQLDRFVNDVMACSNIPGLTLTAVKGKVAFTRGYGKQDIEKDTNATADSVFCIGSLTKAMTTTLLTKLLPQTFPTLTWDTKIKDILGESFKLYTTELTNQARLRDILSHRTGLINADYGLFAGYSDAVTRSRMAKKLQYLPASQPLRYHYDYNNWMYFLAGYIAEVLAGGKESWEDLLTSHVLEPLGMGSTVVLKNLDELASRTLLALPYIYTKGEYKRMASEIFNIHPAEPAGSVCSSATDMAKWLKFLLKSPKNIVNDTVFNETMRPVQLTPDGATGGWKRPDFPVDRYDFAYGLGWFRGAYRGRNTVLHSGGLFAYSSLLWMFPHEEVGAFLSINGMSETHTNQNRLTMSYVADLLLGEIPWLNVTTACSFPEPWKVDAKKNSSQSNHSSHADVQIQRPQSEYVGIYGNSFIGDINVFVNSSLDDMLRITLGTNLQGKLHPTHLKDVFRWEITGPLWFMNPTGSHKSENFYFEDNSNGQIESLSSTNIGRRFIFRKDVRFADNPSLAPLSTDVVCQKLLIVLLFFYYPLLP